MISVVLVEPKNPANIGSVARAMKNFGFNSLVLISPKCSHLSDAARNLAKHAQDVLEGAVVRKPAFLKSFDVLVATTAKLGTDYNIPRLPLAPEQMAQKLKGISPAAKVALLIGREDIGLLNDELRMCDFTVSIPASKSYPTLSVSHSAAILLYELSRLFLVDKSVSVERFAPASAVEKRVIQKRLSVILSCLDFSAARQKETQRRLWRRLIGKAMLTRREAFSLLGFLRKVEQKLKKKV